MSSGLADQPRRARGEVGMDRDRVGKVGKASGEHARQEYIKNRERERVRERGGPQQVGVKLLYLVLIIQYYERLAGTTL